jgi:signal transduction histidine kinase
MPQVYIEPGSTRFKAFFEQSCLPMQVFSLRGTCIASNRAWENYFQSTHSDLVRYNLFQDQQLVEKGLLPYFHRAYAGEAVEVPAFYYDPVEAGRTGRARWLEAFFFTVKNLGGAVVELAVILKDVTDSQRALDGRDEFLSIASHELRTPLTPMKLQLQALMKMLKGGGGDLPNAEKIFKIVEATDKQLERMVSLIENLLDVTRINSGKLCLNLEPVDVPALLSEVCERYFENGVRFECVMPVSKQTVYGVWDRTRIEQVIVNLLNNAVKYAPGAPITLRFTCNEGWALISVIDNGPGIDASNLERIFNRFEQAHDAQAVGGLGLGLYIARQIVEAHLGKIWAESTYGKGAAFFVQLPLVSECH